MLSSQPGTITVSPLTSISRWLGWRGETYLLVVSFYGTDTHDREALGRLAHLASMTLAVLVRQYAPVGQADARSIIAGRLRRSLAALSAPEAQVCALTIIGKSSADVGAALSIAPGAVLPIASAPIRRPASSRRPHWCR